MAEKRQNEMTADEKALPTWTIESASCAEFHTNDLHIIHPNPDCPNHRTPPDHILDEFLAQARRDRAAVRE